MTIFLPLEADLPHPSKPLFLVQSSDVTMQLQKVIQSILMARRIIVVCSASISVSAGVSDFHSPEGIFQLLRHGHPTGGLVSGKDLFYASVFSIDHVTEPFPTSTSAPTDQEVPRCIPLYGSVQWIQCTLCMLLFSLQDHIDSLSSGKLPTCPMCTATELGQQRMGLRQWGMGKLHPSIVLYNEAHHNRDEVGEIMYRDLMGFKGRGGADLLLVAGTSLKVPGTKWIVKEFLKSVRQGTLSQTKDHNIDCSPERAVRSQTSCRSEGWQSSCSDPAPEALMKVLYLNLDFPMPMQEWQGVFNIWVQGNVQQFAWLLQDEIDQQAKANQPFVPRKRK
ncbi:NAD-dependent histone deacetylase HST4 [Leucoagaricus sp. SymC.cos]|nr:NAD-dependent histone deacetylase HST4 [Leucoagaricus sp. SymC.cos]